MTNDAKAIFEMVDALYHQGRDAEYIVAAVSGYAAEAGIREEAVPAPADQLTMTALHSTAREAAAQMVAHEVAFQRAVSLVGEINSILSEPLDERVRRGPTRAEQFARIESLLHGWPAPLGREGFDWGECYRRAEGWVADRLKVDLEAARRAASDETQRDEPTGYENGVPYDAYCSECGAGKGVTTSTQQRVEQRLGAWWCPVHRDLGHVRFVERSAAPREESQS